ncbi:MAG: Maf family nucleotide pyrophosphatase [Prolixibacteraceae bacterium]|nr:Maf family nucleotide pyrophosphatase [Prolixibacteraceae bacterium]
MLVNMLEKYNVILASKSPRRKHLLSELGIKFDIVSKDVAEVFPENLEILKVPEYLAKIKAEPFINEVDDKTLVITSDTIVAIDDEILGKPRDYKEAVEMLNKLSGRTHTVATGVFLYNKKREVSFTATTDVTFKELTSDEINYYIENYNPYDKAGGYGIQEWFGYVAVEKINGSYFNVMGLPVHKLYEELCKF